MDPSVSYGERLLEFVKTNARAIFMIGFILLALQDVFGTHGVVAMRRSQKEAEQIRQQINQLNDENRQLDQRVKDLKSDPHAVEEIARQDMNLARPGEIIFKVGPNGGNAAQGSSTGDPSLSPAPAKKAP